MKRILAAIAGALAGAYIYDLIASEADEVNERRRRRAEAYLNEYESNAVSDRMGVRWARVPGGDLYPLNAEDDGR